MNTLINSFGRTFILLLTMFLITTHGSASYADETGLAAVGYYAANGEIQLVKEEFKTHFVDGSPVKDISVRVINDFLYVARKGYTPDGECFTEVASLVDKFGQQLTSGSDPAFCSSVYIADFYPVKLVSCKENGCHALKGVVLADGSPILSRAFCDMTELSEGKCRCHIDRGQGLELLNSTQMCKTEFRNFSMVLVDWLYNPRARVHTIDTCVQQ